MGYNNCDIYYVNRGDSSWSDVKKFPKDDKIYYIRPENLKVVDSSSNSIIIEKLL